MNAYIYIYIFFKKILLDVLREFIGHNNRPGRTELWRECRWTLLHNLSHSLLHSYLLSNVCNSHSYSSEYLFSWVTSMIDATSSQVSVPSLSTRPITPASTSSRGATNQHHDDVDTHVCLFFVPIVLFVPSVVCFPSLCFFLSRCVFLSFPFFLHHGSQILSSSIPELHSPLVSTVGGTQLDIFLTDNKGLSRQPLSGNRKRSGTDLIRKHEKYICTELDDANSFDITI